MQKNNAKAAWQPSASMENLRNRALLYQRIRHFFAERGVMEVETPLLGHTSVTDPFIESIATHVKSQADHSAQLHYLQTSPEYAMKRLLAAGCGSIYQITKAFRQGEFGRLHNPEFTLLEWYRIGWTHHELMDEMDSFLQTVIGYSCADRSSYATLFLDFLNLDPHQATLAELKQCAQTNSISIASEIHDKDTWLNLLMSHCIEPHLGKTKPCFVYDFPASQAALAKLSPINPNLASRFEVYISGIELANGFHELQSVAEQRHRFEKNLATRRKLGLTELPIDEYFLSALGHGLPECAGVALGLDRLLMLASGSEHIAEVLSFDFTRV